MIIGTTLFTLLSFTRKPVGWAGHSAVLQRGHDQRHGVPHCPWRRTALSALKLPPGSRCSQQSDLMGDDACDRGQTAAAVATQVGWGAITWSDTWVTMGAPASQNNHSHWTEVIATLSKSKGARAAEMAALATFIQSEIQDQVSSWDSTALLLCILSLYRENSFIVALLTLVFVIVLMLSLGELSQTKLLRFQPE